MSAFKIAPERRPPGYHGAVSPDRIRRETPRAAPVRTDRAGAPPARRAAAGRAAGRRALAGVAAAGAAAAAYMAFEAQWTLCREAELAVPGLPAPWSGLTVLHLSDVHAGSFYTNERSLRKAVRWAVPLAPDLVLLTGDVLGGSRASRACLALLAELEPPLGMIAVTGNHEYGLSKGPLARPRDTSGLWERAGITLLADSCVTLPARDGTTMVLCGADHLTGGYGLTPPRGTGPQAPPLHASVATASATVAPPTPFGPRPTPSDVRPAAPRSKPRLEAFPILLVHAPPPPDSPLTAHFPLAFAGHTHGGQLRVPTASGLRPLHRDSEERLTGVHPWGSGLLVVSPGIGTSFLPFRLLTRPEATLWRLVYTSCGETSPAGH
jgi:predicted MPP superfamily phosphohydrolase